MPNSFKCIYSINTSCIWNSLKQEIFSEHWTFQKLDKAFTKAQNHKTKVIQTHKINRTGLDHSYKFYSFVLVLYKEFFFLNVLQFFRFKTRKTSLCHFFAFVFYAWKWVKLLHRFVPTHRLGSKDSSFAMRRIVLMNVKGLLCSFRLLL